MASDTLTILDGSTFVVSDRAGDIEASIDMPHGLFYRDTRFLSRWRLTVDGRALDVLSTDAVDYFSTQFFLVPSTGTIYQNPTLSVIRQRFVGDGFHEDVIVLNHSQHSVAATLRLEAGADFADLFEVKDALQKKGTLYRETRASELVLGYRRETLFARRPSGPVARSRRMRRGWSSRSMCRRTASGKRASRCSRWLSSGFA